MIEEFDVKTFISFFLLFIFFAPSTLAFAGGKSSQKTITEYFSNNNLIVERKAFYNTAATQRVEYYCEDENLPGGENAGASNPANVHCTAALFLKRHNNWMFSDKIELRYGSVKKFTEQRLEIEMLEYGAEDALCCPSERWTRIFNIKSGRFVEDTSTKKKTRIVQAVKYGVDKMHILELINQGNDINAKDEYGQTALMAAAANNNAEITTLLLEHNANVNATRNNGKTALIIAADNGSISIVKLLLEKGANPNISNNKGWSALYYAIRSDKHDISRLLVENGANVNDKTKRGETVLQLAAVMGNEDIVRLLLGKGADVHVANEGTTILRAAATSSRCNIVRLLLDNGASANEETWGDTVLMRAAAYSNDTDCLQALLEKGADINAKANNGETPLFYAIQYGPVANVKWLLEHGANRNAIALGMTPLEAARKMKRKEVVELLEKQIPQ